MTHHPINLEVRSSSRWRPRQALSSIEVLVAFTLLTTVLSVSAPLLIRNSRLIVAQREYRVALDELSNQLDRVTTLSPNELPAAMDHLAPSDFVTTRLPGAKLSGGLEPSDLGTRLTLKLSWDDPGHRRTPIVLSAWVYPKPLFEARQTGGETP